MAARREAIAKMKHLQELLQSKELRHTIQSASDENAALRAVRKAATAKGYELDLEWIKEAFDDVKLLRQPASLTESELLLLGSTWGVAPGTAPMLCHTDSCGGHHAGCCKPE